MEAIIGRVLLGLLFIAGAVQKSADPVPVVALLQGMGWRGWLIWPALAFNAVAGLMLVAGYCIRPVARSLAAYCVVTSAFHFLPHDGWQMSIFIKNWAIAGGLLVLSSCSRPVENPPTQPLC